MKKIGTKKRTAPAFLFCLLGLAVVAAQTPAQTPASQARPAETQAATDPLDASYRITAEVDLVNLRATVLDSHGQYREDLEADDFQVFEDGQTQKVSFFAHDLRVPLSVGILIDASGSMKFKMEHALQTVREIARALAPQDEMFLVSFNSGVHVRHRFTNDAEQIEHLLKEIKSGGETAMYDAISQGIREMKAARHAKKVLLLITDGFDTRSRVSSTQAEEILKRSDVMVYAVGIDDDENDASTYRRTRYHIYHHAFNRLTAVSGGRAFRMFTGHMTAIQGIARQLVAELHQQYTLGYYPLSRPGSAGGSDWRQVEIKITRPASQIWYRPGYYVQNVKQSP